MKGRRITGTVAAFALLIPFGWLVAIAFFATSGPGSFRLDISNGGLLTNFAAVLDPSVGTRSFFDAYFASLLLSVGAALVSVAFAFPIARLVAPLISDGMSAAMGAFVATRLVPVTASLPIVLGLIDWIGAPSGLFTVFVVYVLMFLPLACACVLAADWSGIRDGVVLLRLDAVLSDMEEARHVLKQARGDLSLAGAAVFLFCWSEFFFASFALRPGETTLAKYFASFETINGFLWGPLAASLVLCLAPVGLLLLAVGLTRRRTLGYA